MNLYLPALQDCKLAISQYRAWLHLGFWDVKQRYQRSVLGPWWITISMMIFIFAMGKIFSRLFAQNLAEYVPFFTTGFLLWSFISVTINEATDLFKTNSGFIKQIKLPYHLYLFKLLVRNIIILAHNFVVYFLVIWFFQLNPGWKGVLAIPAFFLLLINLYWISLFVALMSTRFRDMVPIINSCLQILFFVTPISWMPKLLEDSKIVQWNPFVYFIEILRQPLLGSSASLHAWVITFSIAVIGTLLSLTIFNAVRSRIPFWVD